MNRRGRLDGSVCWLAFLMACAQRGPSHHASGTSKDAGVDAGEHLSAEASMEDTGVPSLAPVRVIRGDPATRVSGFADLTIRGVALAAYESQVVTIRLGDPKHVGERLGSGQARIVGGSFARTFAHVWENGLYYVKRAFIDVDGDGTCQPAIDRVFVDERGVAAPELFVNGGPQATHNDFPERTTEEDCALFNMPWPEQ